MMGRYLVWDPATGKSAADAQTFEASGPLEAAEAWAAADDRKRPEHAVVLPDGRKLIVREIAPQQDPHRQTYIDVVFDGPPGPVAGRFVEVEDADGKSIREGEWIHRVDGLWVLRIWKAAPAPAPTP